MDRTMSPLPIPSLTFFKSLTFGGLVAAGIGYFLCLAFPHILVGGMGIGTFCGFMALLGAGTQRGIINAYTALFPPVKSFVSYYEGIIEAKQLLHRGIINGEKYDQIIESLTNQRFFNSYSIPPNQKQL